MKKNYQLVDVHQAEKILRFVNFIIDYGISMITTMVLWLIGLFFYSIVSGIDFEFLLMQLENINTYLDSLITATIYVIFCFLIEWLSNGKSLGKLITGTRVLMADGGRPNHAVYFKRNISRIVPFDMLSFFGRIGWHDKWSDTRVVNWKKYEEALRREIELDQLGNKETANF